MASYLVTGAAGFIGRGLVRKLLAEGHEVWAMDNLSTGSVDNLPHGVRFIQGNCQDETVYAPLRDQRLDAVFHIAGQSSGEISFDDPVYDLQTNTQSTLLLLQLAREVGCRRLVYASSMSVYGEQSDAPVPEDAPLVPLSFYGVGKMASEHYLRLYERFGIRSTALRLFNVYGPGQNMKNLRQGMVSIYMAQMLESGRIEVRGGPNRYRDFVHLDDVVRACLHCLDQGRDHCGPLNIGTGSGPQSRNSWTSCAAYTTSP